MGSLSICLRCGDKRRKKDSVASSDSCPGQKAAVELGSASSFLQTSQFLSWTEAFPRVKSISRKLIVKTRHEGNLKS